MSEKDQDMCPACTSGRSAQCTRIVRCDVDSETIRRATLAAHNPEAALEERRLAEEATSESEKPWPGLTDEQRVNHLFPPNPGGEPRPIDLKPRWTVSAFLTRGNRVLLIRHKRLDLWLPVGGGIEEGERPIQAVAREVREETGLLIDAVEHVMFEEHWVGAEEPWTDERLHMNHAYRARVISHGKPVSDGSWDSHTWLRLGETPPKRTPDNVRRILDTLARDWTDEAVALIRRIRTLVDRSGALVSRERFMSDLMEVLDSTPIGCIGWNRPEATRRVPDVREIVAWLHGLESARESIAVGGSDPREVAIMQARRGVYEGVADDIQRKWG